MAPGPGAGFVCVLLLAGWLWAPSAGGHIGSPDVFFEGEAGPWPVRVIIRPPEVVPGLAEISVRVHGPGVEAVRVRSSPLDSSSADAPPPEEARKVAGDRSLWRVDPRFMASGFYNVHIEVDGAAGTGTVLVPVHCVAIQKVELDPRAKILWIALGLLLAAGFGTLVGSTVKVVLEPGSGIEPGLVRGALGAMAVALVLSHGVLYGPKGWWNTADATTLHDLSGPFSISAAMGFATDSRVLEIVLDDERFRRAPALVPDHGKSMHVFLIREPTLDTFAHLHPIQVGELTYSSPLPSSLPSGTYRLYADVTHANGITQTLTTTVDLVETVADPGPPRPSLAVDPDDSWHLAGPQEGAVHPFADGFAMDWDVTAPLRVGDEVTLRFQLRDTTGAPAPLEPYMGMLGHAAIRRHDGTVFIHLHPTGTVSMASWQVSEQREAARQGLVDGDAGMDHAAMGHASPMAAESVAFPYEFPKPGTYRLWVQVKSDGRIYTGVFDASVEGDR